jgi:hypothetical protein
MLAYIVSYCMTISMYNYFILRVSFYTNKLYNRLNVNNIILPDTNKGILIITNHINCIETISDLLNNDSEKNYISLVTDLLLICKSLNTLKKINQIYFPSYNKDIYFNKYVSSIYKSSTNIVNHVSEMMNIISKKHNVNLIYSYKSTEQIIEFLNKGEIVVIMYHNKSLLKYDKLKYLYSNSDFVLMPLHIKKEKSNYKISKKIYLEKNITLNNFKEIENHLFI